uniref:Putative secreted protein n=1 Tax=Anopheles marajoara TaxID=58244 RepID=A0A2M4CCA8_9DIPT
MSTSRWCGASRRRTRFSSSAWSICASSAASTSSSVRSSFVYCAPRVNRRSCPLRVMVVSRVSNRTAWTRPMPTPSRR